MKRIDNSSNPDIDELLKDSIKRRLLDRKKILNEILQSDVEYRHGVKAIRVSDIAQQYFCEAKVENEYIHGKIETEAKKEGKEIHELMLTAEEELELEKLVEKIAVKSRTFVAELTLISKIDGCYVIGKPDLVVFSYGCPEYIIEIKTTARSLKIWNNEVVQARMYGLLLHNMGFSTRGLTLVIAKVRRDMIDKDLLDEIQWRVFKHVEDLIYTLKSEEDIKKEDKLYSKVYSFRTYPFDLQKAYEEFKWAKDYWLNRRKEPKSTTKFNKCKSCEYKDICKYSLAKIS